MRKIALLLILCLLLFCSLALASGIKIYDNKNSSWIRIYPDDRGDTIWVDTSEDISEIFSKEECFRMITNVEEAITAAKARKKTEGCLLEGVIEKDIAHRRVEWTEDTENYPVYHMNDYGEMVHDRMPKKRFRAWIPIRVGWEVNYKDPWPYSLVIKVYDRGNDKGILKFNPDRAKIILRELKEVAKSLK